MSLQPITLIYGFPTSGKSTLQRRELLESRVLVDTDDITAAAFPAYWAARGEFTSEYGQIMEAVARMSARVALNLDPHVILTNLYNDDFLRSFKQLFKQRGDRPIDHAFLSTPERAAAIANARGDDGDQFAKWAYSALLRVPVLAKKTTILHTTSDFMSAYY